MHVHRRAAKRTLQSGAVPEMIRRLRRSAADDRSMELENVVELEIDGLDALVPLDHNRYGRGVLASGS